MKLSQIKANPNNPRVLRDEKFQKLKKSIEEFPKMMELRPIVIDENNTILGGNMRFRALQDLGYKEIEDSWVKKANELTEKQKQEFIIKDNVSFGEWNWEDLANEWEVELLNEWGLNLPDFTAEVDYSILDEEDTGESLQNMTDGVYKSIQIEFKLEDYERAYELCQFSRGKKLYLGELIINLLQNIKDGYDKQN